MNNKRLIKLLKDNPMTAKQIAKSLKTSPKEVNKKIRELKDKGINIESKKYRGRVHYYIPLKKAESKPISLSKVDYFALIGDTHIGSKYFEEACLLDFYDTLSDRGVKYVFHAGDVFDGVNVYRGQVVDLELLTLQDQIEYAIKNYPKLKKGKNFLVTGNHDLKQYQKQGVDPVKILSENRDDIEYLGQYSGKVILKDDIVLELGHPDGGSVYAKSYRLQTYLRERPISDYPHILALGHLHTAIFMEYQDILTYQVGCFMSSNDYTRRKGLMPSIGGWIVELDTEYKRVKSVKNEFVKY